ncbi:MAG: Methionyl-tRNA formyltransferase [Candidatus Moranbacteria bacterium GW2011_GWE1_36_7]|nr:MAG: Methionyl-tRNA formyltransferase [Candidatus Moranbacteria bacterium GW2011_GWD2_36_12]KKQ04687.1 MAG: Methionyl-tRNA formyltransferase [Candidatus Moranbacteria bacterium GW2011_GWE2_36_40]KKQ11946.1 MAG: Methionyl-tRNA formyltransferase [Candidatus Moranbacteria bacterium GW2011_GWE1_36_7]
MDSKKIKLRVVFMGTSDLSETILGTLVENEYNVVGVFTKPDMKVGRKQEIEESLVKKMAKEKNIPVFQPLKFNSDAVEELKKLKPDLIIVAAYGKIIPKSALEIPGFGCINVHVSLLPKYRGPSPIQNALLSGEKETGVTIMFMDEGVDTGDIIVQEKTIIEPEDTTATLMQKMSVVGSQLLLKTIPLLIEGKIEKTPQDNTQATLCQLIERSDGKIFWTDSAENIYNRYRALTPWPGIFTFWKNGSEVIRLKLNSIGLQKINPIEKHQTGEVFELGSDIGVQTENGIIILKELQLEGKKVTDAKSFINGYPNFIGSILQ